MQGEAEKSQSTKRGYRPRNERHARMMNDPLPLFGTPPSGQSTDLPTHQHIIKKLDTNILEFTMPPHMKKLDENLRVHDAPPYRNKRIIPKRTYKLGVATTMGVAHPPAILPSSIFLSLLPLLVFLRGGRIPRLPHPPSAGAAP